MESALSSKRARRGRQLDLVRSTHPPRTHLSPIAASSDTPAAMRLLIAAIAALLVSCATTPAPPAASASSEKSVDPDAEVLASITAVHGGAGPWVVAGYRMGSYALAKLGLVKGSFDLEVVHHAPHEVQYSCIADGAAAATGASLGRLSLTLTDSPAAATRTTYRKRSTGEQVTLQTTAAFGERYKDVPRPQLMAAGREVLHLGDSQIFREIATDDSQSGGRE